ncbi:MAG: hypothetical protein RIR97_2136 [Pseudomonadota bacterium]
MLGSGKVVVVTAGGMLPNILINAESRLQFLARRARKFGWIFAVGQLLTMIVSRIGKSLFRKRLDLILRTYEARFEQDKTIPLHVISSINDPESWKAVLETQPAVILCVSCRILDHRTLSAFSCPVLNFHAGILPHYRGLFGGYWSRIENDEVNFGGTVHLVDRGVDTGHVLYRSYSKPDPTDMISTYPVLQTAGSQAIVIQAIKDALSGDLKPEVSGTVFPQRYHPPIWTYVKNGLTRKIW